MLLTDPMRSGVGKGRLSTRRSILFVYLSYRES